MVHSIRKQGVAILFVFFFEKKTWMHLIENSCPGSHLLLFTPFVLNKIGQNYHKKLAIVSLT